MSESAARGASCGPRTAAWSDSWTWTMPDLVGEFVPLVVSPSGASETCPVCGTVYDRHELVGYVPPVGDGCDNCAATEEDIDALTT